MPSGAGNQSGRKVNAPVGNFLLKMNRANNLFEKIVDYNNFRDAYLKSLKGKRNNANVIKFSKNLEQNLERVRKRILIPQNYFPKPFHQFYIYDPKKRLITAVPFEERIIHHAIINVLESVFERQFIFHTYACRKGKGTDAAIKYVQKSAYNYEWYAKLDVKKFFDNINHTILKNQLLKIIKDKKCLDLLFGIIDSYFVCDEKNDFDKNELQENSNNFDKSENLEKCGLPIGNLTSQFLANLYLSALDHFALEKIGAKGYVRYMDDFLIFADSKTEVIKKAKDVNNFINSVLKMQTKETIFGLCKEGVPYLGKKIFPQKVLRLSKNLHRRLKKIRQIDNLYKSAKITEQEAQNRRISLSLKII